MFNSKMSNVNAPFTPMGIAVWYTQGNKLSIVSTQNAEVAQRAVFTEKMSYAKQGMIKAAAERLERTKALAERRKHGTDGQKRH